MKVINENHIARKRFGQNFLVDNRVIDKIITAFHPQANDHVVEIGPGLGALTMELLPLLNSLSVVEIDRDLIAKLKKLQHEKPALQIYHADALQFDFLTLSGPLRVIGNLPYNISTPLLFHLFTFWKHIADMYFMLQKEVVDRLTAEPGTPHYGRLSVTVQYYAEATKLFNVKPGSFNPAPKVDSAVVRLNIRPPAIPADNPQHFSKIVRYAFAQRRKTLKNNFKGLVEPALLESSGINPNARAETLSVADFVRLSNEVIRQSATE